MKHALSKSNGVLRETVQDARHSVKVVYTRAITWSLTTSGSTEGDRWTMYRLVWLVATRIDHDSLHVSDVLTHLYQKFH